MKRLTLVVALALALPRGGSAQISYGGFGEIYLAQRVVSSDLSVYEQTGLLFGGGANVRRGRLSAELSGVVGTLSGDGSADESMRTSVVRLLIDVTPWLSAGARVEGRVFESDVAISSWRGIGIEVSATPSLGRPGLNGVLALSMMPVTAVGVGAALSTAMQGRVGAQLVTERGFSLLMEYRFERYDFEPAGTSPSRLDQLSGLVLSASLQLGRR